MAVENSSTLQNDEIFSNYKCIRKSMLRAVDTGNYTKDCQNGRDYAEQFLMYLSNNPETIGRNILGLVAELIPDENGFSSGFWSRLEKEIFNKR